MHCYYYAYSRKLVEFYFELLFRRGDLLISDGGGGGFGLAAALFLFLFFFSFFFSFFAFLPIVVVVIAVFSSLSFNTERGATFHVFLM